MPVTIPPHIAGLQSYKPGKPIEQIAKENDLNELAVLWNNENPLGASPKAMEEVRKALQGAYRYPDPMSIELRRKIAQRVGRDIDEVVVGNGGEGILMTILEAFCNGDDELLTSNGSFVIIYIWCRINNVPCRQVPLKSDYSYDMDAIFKAITPKTKVIYLATPNNPTGTAIPRAELEAFIAKVPDHILIVIDEAYYEFARALDPDFPDCTKMRNDNILTLRSFSKAYGIASVRLGFAVALPYLIEPLLNAKLTFEPTGLAQAAGIGALDDEDFLKKTMDNNRRGLTYLYQELDRLGLPYVHSLANFVMIDLQTEEKAQVIFRQLMQRGVFVRPTGGSGLPHCIRVSVGTERENELFIRKMEEVIGEKWRS
jgi:histidinol-phosphate aminotransferase